jgi:hypothetical protein
MGRFQDYSWKATSSRRLESIHFGKTTTETSKQSSTPAFPLRTFTWEFPELGKFHLVDALKLIEALETLKTFQTDQLTLHLEHQRGSLGLYIYEGRITLIMLQVTGSLKSLPERISLDKGLRFPGWRLFINHSGQMQRYQSHDFSTKERITAEQA